MLRGTPFFMSPYFLSCDWGTSHFRLRLVDTASLAVLGEIKTGEGASSLFQQSTPENRPQLFAATLIRQIEALFLQAGHTATSSIISGMASSSIGWFELPYAVAPMPLAPDHFQKHAFDLPVAGQTVRVTLVSGVRTGDDVMRGEECELLGLLEVHPALGSSRACVLLPGTHSKHIHLNGRNLEGFVTYMTGELFTHLRGLPTLKTPLAAEGETSELEFCEGVRAAQKFGPLAGLFKIRTRSLIAPHPGLHAPSFLSGLLIGSELLGLQLPADTAVYLAGSPTLHPLYILAGKQIGLSLQSISPDILQQSLLHAHRSLLPSRS